MNNFSITANNKQVSFHLIQNDITTMKVDAIVNAANEMMLGGGGVDGAIHKVAGPELFEECKNIQEISDGCRCPTGEARITKGYNLPAKYVIHTVAPRFIGTIENYYKNKDSDEKLKEIKERLIACYVNCLRIANEHDVKTIAFPSLGTGIYSIPIQIASNIAVHTVTTNIVNNPSLDEVYFVTFSKEDYDQYEAMFDYVIYDILGGT